jgi:hypothetical protein
MKKWEITFSTEAAHELKAIVAKNPDLKPDILARLKVLEDFPPERWFFVYKFKGLVLFRAETDQMIRLSGEAHPETKTVQITHVVLTRKPT